MSMTPSRRQVETMTLGYMALDNRTIIARCYQCRKVRVFLAVDLVKVYGDQMSPHTIFNTCTTCGSALRKDFGFPKRGETIRRPQVVTKWKWRDEVYDPDKISLPTRT